MHDFCLASGRYTKQNIKYETIPSRVRTRFAGFQTNVKSLANAKDVAGKSTTFRTSSTQRRPQNRFRKAPVQLYRPCSRQKIRPRSPENGGRLTTGSGRRQTHRALQAAGRRRTRTKFEKWNALKSCAKVVIALATLAGGLLLIRVCGEQRLQSLVNMVFLKKTIPDNAVVSKNRHVAMVSNHNHTR